jgi:hypothetical protein
MSRYKLEVMLSEELLARLDAARLFEPRASFARRALEAALSEAKGPPLREQAGPVPSAASNEGVRPAAPPRASRDVPAESPLPKIAKRKW